MLWKVERPVIKILVLKISVRRAKFFSTNIGLLDYFFHKFWSPSENFGPLDLMVKIPMCSTVCVKH